VVKGASGTDGLTVNGTTGEGYTLTVPAVGRDGASSTDVGWFQFFFCASSQRSTFRSW
jgi:hypothetical protein